MSWLCSELRLSVTHTTLTLPDPEDLASSQIEIEQYRAKKAAVEKGSKDRASSKPKTTPAGVSKPSVGVQRRCVEERVVLREVWVDMARLLIQQVGPQCLHGLSIVVFVFILWRICYFTVLLQGEYQLARDLLNQSMLSSQVHTHISLGLSLVFSRTCRHLRMNVHCTLFMSYQPSWPCLKVTSKRP